jgi:phospholipid/cholesterol/gamma-HCH transport system ATP-binding protein
LIIRMKKEMNAGELIITHDMVSAYKVADRIGMLYEGKIIEMGSPEEIKNSKNPVVQQFIRGSAEGPIENW